MSFDYRQVKDLYDLLADAGATTKSLPEWSREMNLASGSDIYSEGLNDNFLKRTSVAIDRGLESIPGLVSGSRELGRSFGGMFGMASHGAELGASLPRMGLNFLPLLIPGAGQIAGAARLAGLAGLSGIDTYTRTNSPAAGILSGLTNAAMPKVADLAEQAILRGMGGRLVKGSLATSVDANGLPITTTAINRFFPTNIGQTAAAFTGGNVAAAALGETSGIGQDVLTGQPIHDVFSAETLMNNTLGMLPFVLMNQASRAVGLAKGPKRMADQLEAAVKQTDNLLKLKEAKEAFEAKTDIERVPLVPEEQRVIAPDVQAGIDDIISNLGKRRDTIVKNPTPENVEELKQIRQAEDAAVEGAVIQTGGVGLGLTTTSGKDSAKIEIIGENHFGRNQPNGRGYHTITVSNVPENVGLTYPDGSPIMPGDRIRFPAGYQDPVVNWDINSPSFLLPRNKFTKIVDRPLERPATKAGDPIPELPIQRVTLDLEQHAQNVKTLDALDIEAAGVTSYAEALDMLTKVNMVRSVAGYPEIDLASLIKTARSKKLKSDKDAVRALIAETKTLQLAEQAATADRLIEMQSEVLFEASLRSSKDPEHKAILRIYDELSNSSGRRSDVATSGLFWQKAMELQAKGQLTAQRMSNWKEGDVVAQGTGLKKNQVSAPFPKVEFEPMDAASAAFHTIVAKKAMEVTAATPWPDDAKIFRRLVMVGDLTFSKDAIADAAFDTGLAESEIHAQAMAEDFASAPHVIKWAQELRATMTRNERTALPAPGENDKFMAPREQEGPQIDAGGGFVWNLAPYNEATNRLGDRHTVPKSGELTEAQLKAIGGRGKPLQDVEIEMMKAIDAAVGGKAFDGKGNVNLKTLTKVLKESGPVVEVKKLGDTSTNYNQREAQILHELDTKWPTWRQEVLDSETGRLEDLKGPTPEIEQLRQEYVEFAKEVASDENPSARYSFLGPKSEQEMPGYVEGLVRVPESKIKAHNVDNPSNPTEVSDPRSVKYRGPHFGSEDTNVLAFFRGYEENVGGKKVFHVIEVQSDWGQEQKRLSDKIKEEKGKVDPETRDNQFYEKKQAEGAHPLLSSYETLALKAAIQHAREIGADAVMLSDAETAMMTEGHDKAAQGTIVESVELEAGAERGRAVDKLHEKYPDSSRYDIIRRPDRVVVIDNKQKGKPEQDAGMRLHYDSTLPSALAKLTGQKGERVEVGTHHKQTGWSPEATQDPDFVNNPRDVNIGSPVFKNPDGTPKSSITGRLYPIQKASEVATKQGGFTLGDPNRAPKEYVPLTEADKTNTQALTGDGTVLVDLLERSVDPLTQSIARDLRKNFPEMLKLVESSVVEGNGSFAQALELGQRVRIDFDPSVVTSAAWARENVVLHELIHGLTLQQFSGLNVDSPLVGKLTQLREHLISQLPKELRVRYHAAVKSNWKKRNDEDPSGEVWMELAPKQEERAILYALMNNEEFTAQGFSSHSFRHFMQSVKGPKTAKTGFKAFVGWIRELLHMDERINNTAFESFMETTNQLMVRGEFMANMQQFGESYFRSMGKSDVYGKLQTERALGIIAESRGGISKEEMIASLGMIQTPMNQEMTRAATAFKRLLTTDEAPAVKQLLEEQGVAQDILGLDYIVEEGIALDSSLNEFIDLLPPEGAKYVFEKLRDHRDVLAVIAEATKKNKEALVNIADPKLLRGPVNETIKSIDKILKNEARLTETAELLVGMAAVEPSGFVTRAAGAPREVERFFSDVKDNVSGVGQWITKFLEPMGQMARRVPEAAEIIAKGFELGPNARKMFNESVKAFGVDASSEYIDPSPTHESVQKSQKVFSNPKLLSIADKWIYWNNKVGGAAVKMLNETHPEIAKLLSKLTTEEKALVHDAVSKQSRSIQTLNAQKIEKMMQIAAIHGAAVAGADNGMKTKDNLALADTLLKGVLDASNPMTMVFAQSQINSVQMRMQPEAFINLLKFTQGEAQKIQLWKEYFDANPAWSTAQRTERFLVRYTQGGKVKLGQASSLVEARDLIDRKGGKQIEIVDQWKGRDDEPFAFPNMTPEMAARMKQIEENQIEMLTQRGVLSPEDIEQFRKTSAVSQILREAASEQAIPGVTTPPRLMSQGADELPWLWNHITYAQRESNYWSRALLRAQARTYLKDPELAGNDQLRNTLKTHFENMLHPDPVMAQNIRKAASVWFLGFNVATAMVNAAQPFVTHVAELTSLSGKPLDSYRRILRALNETNGRFLGDKEWSTEEHRRFQQDAVHDGEVGIGKYDDDIAAQESIATNYKRAMMKNKTQSLGQRLSTAAGAYSNAAMWLFQQGERLNSRTALLASFDYYREQGLSYEEAKQKAYEFNRAVNYGGGRAQRSVGAFSGRGAFPRSLAMLGTSLQSYVWGSTFQIVRYLQRGGFRPNGLKPHEVYSARKAGIQMLATQLAAAGVLGLPFVSGALALLDKAFPDLELNRNLREMMAEFLNSDEEDGSTLTDIAMTGVPSMLGWDMQSRLSMGNSLPGVSEINGFQPENLMGPVGNIVKNFVGGVTGFAKGDQRAGLKFLPPAVSKLVDAGSSFLTDGGAIRDYQGKPLAEPTPGEQIGRALGFQPKRLSDQNAASRIAQQSIEVSKRQLGQFHAELAQEALAGNFGTVRAALLERSQSDTTYSPVEGVRAIARAAEESSFPRDLRREGTRGTSSARSSLLASYSNINLAQPSEVARLQLRKQVEARLGLQSDFRAELELAKTMDLLRQQKPSATRLELRALAQQMLRRSSSSQQTLTLPQE